MSRFFAVLAAVALAGAAALHLANVTPERVASADRLAPVEAVRSAPQTWLPGLADARPAAESAPLEKLTVDYGTVCQTPRGECTVSPAPIGSPCSCGVPGKISR